MPADTVEVIVKLSGLATVQAGMRRLRDAVTAPLEAAVSRVRNFALGMGGTLLAGLSVHRVGTEIKRAVSEMDRADEVAQKLGIAADQLTALDYAATLADSSAESLQNALKFLARAVESNADAFATLGVELRTAEGGFRSPVELLQTLADRFAAMPDGIGKTALTLKLLGLLTGRDHYGNRGRSGDGRPTRCSRNWTTSWTGPGPWPRSTVCPSKR